MILPPLVINVRVYEADKTDFHLWLPLFLLWPLLLVILALVLVVTLLVDFVSFISGNRYRHFTLLVLNSLLLLAAVRGTHAHVNKPNTLVDVDIY